VSLVWGGSDTNSWPDHEWLYCEKGGNVYSCADYALHGSFDVRARIHRATATYDISIGGAAVADGTGFGFSTPVTNLDRVRFTTSNVAAASSDRAFFYTVVRRALAIEPVIALGAEEQNPACP